jgi:ABC-2 type transport system ATP-binding protein
VVARPELVFLDEPTAGLDPQARHATWDVVRQLRDDGVTVVLTTHYMEEAERLADQVVVVDGGRVVALGTPAELTRGGAEGQLRFTAVPGLDLVRLAAALPAKVTVAEPRPGEYLVTVPGPVDPQLVAAVTAWCATQDVLAEELRVQRRSLEDVFLELTGRGLR